MLLSQWHTTLIINHVPAQFDTYLFLQFKSVNLSAFI